MAAAPFRSARDYLDAAPAARAGALLASAASAVLAVALAPLLYLTVDLLATRGVVPAFGDLPPAHQQAVLQDLPADAAKDALAGEAAWQATTFEYFRDHVGPEAAEAYLPTANAPAANGLPPSPSGRPLGLLATAAREQDGWAGPPLAAAARLMPWTWRSGNGPYLLTLCAAAVILSVLRGVMIVAGAFAAATAARGGMIRLRRALFTHMHRLPALAIRPEAQAEAGELVAARAEQVQDGLVAWMTYYVRGLVLIPLLLGIMVAVHPMLALCVLLLGGVVWLISGQLLAWYREDARQAGRRSESRLQLLRENVALGPLVKGYMMDRYSQTRVERHIGELSRVAWRRQRGEVLARAGLSTVGFIAGVTMLYLTARAVLVGTLSPAGLAVIGACLAALVATLNRFIAARVRIRRAGGAAADVAEFLDRRGEGGQPIDATFLHPLTRRFDLEEVSLKEPGTGRMLLERVSLSVAAGEKAALVYADGDEARAVAYLAARFLDPSGGEVRIDGKNVRWVTYESLRTQVCLILEQSLVFSDTAANNIGCGDPGYSLPQIIEAAKLAHAHQFLSNLPYGYETRLTDAGTRLTTGQQFRVALARALLRDPSLVILEEPSAPMDADSVALIDDALNRGLAGRTVLFLARRPSTVKNADRVFVLQNGRIVASGRHEELVEGSELYRLLHFKQSLTASDAGL